MMDSIFENLRSQSDTRANILPGLLSHSALSETVDYQEIKNYLQSKRMQVDYVKLFSVGQIFFFGEVHTSLAAKAEVVGFLKDFKAAGGTHLAMEMFHEDMQASLDRYYQTGDNEEEILKNLKDKWAYGIHVPDAYLAIIKQAKQEGIQFICLDSSPKDEDGESLLGFRNTAGRNKIWATKLAGIIKTNPVAKVISYCGSGHLGYFQTGDSVNQETEKLIAGLDIVSPVVVTFSDNDNDEHPMLQPHQKRAFGPMLGRVARDIGIDQEKFAVISDNGIFGARLADMYIHLPTAKAA